MSVVVDWNACRGRMNLDGRSQESVRGDSGTRGHDHGLGSDYGRGANDDGAQAMGSACAESRRGSRQP